MAFDILGFDFAGSWIDGDLAGAENEGAGFDGLGIGTDGGGDGGSVVDEAHGGRSRNAKGGRVKVGACSPFAESLLCILQRFTTLFRHGFDKLIHLPRLFDFSKGLCQFDKSSSCAVLQKVVNG